MSMYLIGSQTGAKVLVNQELYSDNTPRVKVDEDLSQFDTLLVGAEDMMEFVTAMFLADSVDKFASIKKLVLPYVPGARQDRINPGGDILDTARSVARMINDRYFESVVIADPHSPVITKAINRVRVYPLTLIYDKLWHGYTGVCSADEGGVERATAAAEVLQKPLARGFKHRDVTTGKLSGFSVEGIEPGGHYLVVDDICDGGGTFVGLGEKIREAGGFCDLFVTHGIFTHGASALADIYKNIYTTDTLFSAAREHRSVSTIHIVNDMVNY